MSESMVIAADLGGTNVRMALVDIRGNIIEQRREATNIESGVDELNRRLAAICRSLMGRASDRGGEVRAVGFGVAGKIDHLEGRILFSPNLKELNDYPLGPRLRDIVKIPVILENDANAFGVGEHWVGSGRGTPNWIGLTLGTGVGGCLIFDGQLWHGDHLGVEGEIGHMVIQPGGPRCNCGVQGCLEALASGTALMKGVAAAASDGRLVSGPLFQAWRSGTLEPLGIYESAANGDPVAQELFQRMGWALGIGLASLFTVLGIRHAIIGGGVSAAWEQFIGPLKDAMANHTAMFRPDEMVVLRSSLLDDAALLGAARLAFEL